MKAFYEKLQKAEQSKDERIAKLAKVCTMDLHEVQKNQSLEEWDWWTG
ncbi:MAG: hypothetical protein H0S79_04260 [Anaerolineaceae bacterium]|jgi:hypothetical protein|nr:hypothetical protein [Anaerolineaceae bacterium]